MKFKSVYCLFLLINVINPLYGQIIVCSWNIENFGQSKSNENIEFIANTVKGYDVIVIQEVVAKDEGGAQAVAKLSSALNRKGANWDYTISDITTSSAYKAERYAFIWKTSRLTITGKAWLEKKYHLEIDREPYLATFKWNDKFFTLVNFHAITKLKQPETEIKFLKLLPAEYLDKNLIFCGDFNCPQSHTVFNPLKSIGYKPIFTGQKTSLKETCINNDCLSAEYDNIFYNASKINFIESGTQLFYKRFSNLKEARVISDHIPIWFQFSIN